MHSDDKLLLDKISGLYKKCDRYAMPAFSFFLDEREQAVIEDEYSWPAGYNVMFWGGYKDAQRKMYGVFCDWEDVDKTQFPVSCIKISYKFGDRLSHRDYLGSILGLGLESYTIGDIIVLDDGAYVFVSDDIAEYIVSSLDKVGRRGVKCIICDMDETKIPDPQFETINCISASTRLDAIVSSMLGVSRKEGMSLILSGRVMVNHRERTDGSKDICEGDLLSVRGYGRFVFSSVGNNTRSGRIHIKVQKYL